MDLALLVAEIMLWLVGVWLAFSWFLDIRWRAMSGYRAQLPTVATAGLFIISLVAALGLGTGLHLAWMLPLSFALGLIPPFRQIGSLYSPIIMVGVDRTKARFYEEVLDQYGRMILGGASPDEAFKAIEAKYPSAAAEILPQVFTDEARFALTLKTMVSSRSS